MTATQTLAPTAEQPIMLEHRFVYGRGIVETLATLDENGTLLIEERAGDQTRIIPIMTREGQYRLHGLLAHRKHS